MIINAIIYDNQAVDFVGEDQKRVDKILGKVDTVLAVWGFFRLSFNPLMPVDLIKHTAEITGPLFVLN
ncbi:MAG: hypothetical protein GY782_00345 [Gammaproteobacteria bacterium]|nr:hypothetical protein [Gammaproteobacteria bacterium]